MRKPSRSPRRVWSRWQVQSYVLECYQGIELVETKTGLLKPTRQFLWADSSGEVWIGNSAAFAEHVAEAFDFEPSPWDFIEVNKILLDVGERVFPEHKRELVHKRGPQAQKPDRRKAT